jgi:hypothetical protein
MVTERTVRCGHCRQDVPVTAYRGGPDGDDVFLELAAHPTDYTAPRTPCPGSHRTI